MNLPIPSEIAGFTYYAELLGSAWFYESFFYTLFVAFTSALLSVIFGLAFSLLIWRLPIIHRLLASVYKIPLILPHISVAFLTILLFSRSGLFGSLLFQFGIIESLEESPQILLPETG
jgi:putative spermidine/putrescine transport system permease protein